MWVLVDVVERLVRDAPKEVALVSVAFSPAPPASSERIIVEDLGVPPAPRRQNDGARFWAVGP